MGLDVFAYKDVVKIDANDDALHDTEGNFLVYNDPIFRARADGLVGWWHGEPVHQPGGGLRAGFRAGSYGGYNFWRQELSKIALGCSPETVWEAGDNGKFEGLPFVELIHFTDCDGVIGPQTSAKLAFDFEEGALHLTPRFDDDWQRTIYALFAQAFKAVASNGAVVFR